MNYKYADYLMRNYPINKHSKKYKSQMGGVNMSEISDTIHHPTGGFPSIYLCKENQTYDDLAKEEEKKKREYTSHQTTIKIQDILKKRRDVVPFISM